MYGICVAPPCPLARLPAQPRAPTQQKARLKKYTTRSNDNPERLERNRSLRRGRPHARERAQPSAASAAVWLRPTSSVAAGLGLSDTLVELEIMILDS